MGKKIGGGGESFFQDLVLCNVTCWSSECGIAGLGVAQVNVLFSFSAKAHWSCLFSLLNPKAPCSAGSVDGTVCQFLHSMQGSSLGKDDVKP